MSRPTPLDGFPRPLRRRILRAVRGLFADALADGRTVSEAHTHALAGCETWRARYPQIADHLRGKLDRLAERAAGR